jgi:hypothetical protein
MVKLPPWLLDHPNDNKAAIQSCVQFRWALVGLISTWCLFYFLVFWEGTMQTPPPGLFPVIDLFNNLQGVFLFACYWILTAKTTSSKEGDKELVPLWAVYLYLLWFVFIFLVVDVLFSVLSRSFFQLLSGLWVGASLALLVGCMEGQYLGQPRRIAFILYLYAAHQVSYLGFFDSTLFIERFSTITSLPLKLLFIGFWIWVMEIGLLAFYLKKARQDIDQVDGQWNEFAV